jgi:hypothetical protein
MKKLTFALLLFSVSSIHAQDIPISQYFNILCYARQAQFAVMDSGRFDSICKVYDIDPKDSLNLRKYYTISIMHQLFTTNGAYDGSRGEILNMPYFWHYNSPNPRHGILVNGKKNVAYTTIERKPHNFLGDMIAPQEKFSHPEIGKFSSFGWCSEREMAFACLFSLMGYDAHVIAPSNHAWTEILATFQKTDGDTRTMQITVDNTFNIIGYDIQTPSGHDNVYNRKAFAKEEVALVRGLTVSSSARNRIDKACGDFFACH